jgi:GTPase SAR1 family protein
LQRSKNIDRQLVKSRNHLNKEVKLLLLGPGASGK